MKRIIHLSCLLALSVSLLSAAARSQDFSKDFTVQMIGPWMLHLENKIPEHDTALVKQTVDLLKVQLYQIINVLPPAAIDKLKNIPIWMLWNDPSSRVAAAFYVPTGEDRRTILVHSVVIPNVKNYFDMSLKHQEPILLHEFAHAYQDLYLGNGSRTIHRVYEAALESKRYDSVLYIDGHTAPAYGMKNEWEYFATSTSAYFVLNEHYPFVRSELREFDPAMFDLLTKAWTDPDGFAIGDSLHYDSRDIKGWTTYVNSELEADTVTLNKVLGVLQSELEKIASAISPRALAVLRTVPIYIEAQSPRDRWDEDIAFHPSMDWLTSHGLDPRWAGAVQIVNAKTFLERYEKYGELVVAQFADAYNSKAFGFRDTHLAHLFANARAERKYMHVPSKFRSEDRSPAINNERMYFKELSSIFIRGGSYFPFTKEKLQDYDPDMFKFLHECWEQ